MSAQLTGRHVLAILALFFMTIFIANGALTYFALSTLHGSELENPYDASQSYNAAIAEARAQDERGWTAVITARTEGQGERLIVEFRDRGGARVPGLLVTVHFAHPFDAAQDRSVTLVSDGAGYEGVAAPIVPGRWNLVIEASRGSERVYRSENRIVVAGAAMD
ncbi:MAG TPA: FixH family protein [Roseiarcus sp.]|jgi:nitrogen fixation protein FixH|nr:FixH family protein [Roseiarcus sp.]